MVWCCGCDWLLQDDLDKKVHCIQDCVAWFRWVIWHCTCQADLPADLEVRALSCRMVEESDQVYLGSSISHILPASFCSQETGRTRTKQEGRGWKRV